jgi:apolipoprotein N-acyltransferase
MINMVHLFAEDRRLRAWFAAIEAQPAPARAAAFEKMVREMSASGEDPRLIAAVSALSSLQMFSVVRERVHQLRAQDRFTFPKLGNVIFLALFLGFAALGVYWLTTSLYHDLDAASHGFWPGLISLFVAAAILVFSVVRAVSTSRRKNKPSS